QPVAPAGGSPLPPPLGAPGPPPAPGSGPPAPGTAPRFADAVPVTPKKKSRRGLVIGLIIGSVLLVLLCVGVAAAVGLSRLRSTSPQSAAVGDCLTGTAEGELDANTVRKVDCASGDAKFKVAARV